MKNATSILLVFLAMVFFVTVCDAANDKEGKKNVPKKSDISQEESAQWNKATNPFNIDEMKKYIEVYPHGKYAEEARQILVDEETIDGIEKNGVGERFVVPEVSWPWPVKNGLKANNQLGRTVLEEALNHKSGHSTGQITEHTVFGNMMFQIPTVIGPSTGTNMRTGLSGPFPPCGDRSVFIVKGKVQEVIGSTDDPLRFVLLTDKGLVHIGGKGKVNTPEMVRASHILVKVDSKATAEEKAKALGKIKDIQKRIQSGEDFAQVAKEVSDCPSKENGGDLNFFQRGLMVPPFENAAFSMNPGDTSDIVETVFGYHIIRVTDKRAAGTKVL